MSLTTIGKNGRVYQRKYDHERARWLHDVRGWSYKRLAAHYGVSVTAIEYACNDKTRARMLAAAKAGNAKKRRPCLGNCGRLVWMHQKNKNPSGYCPTCHGLRVARTVRETTLLCSRCAEWKPDESFPKQAAAKARRGRHQRCRPCGTAERREHRARNREADNAYQREYKRRIRAKP